MNENTEESSLTFEQAYAALEEIVNSFESGQLGLEESVNMFRKATELLNICRRKLAAAERQIAQLKMTVQIDQPAESEELPPPTDD